MLVKFADEYEAESWSWLFVPLGWRMCCAGGFYNAWCPRESEFTPNAVDLEAEQE